MSYNEKIDILQNCWKPTSSFIITRKQQYDQQTFKTEEGNKVISFQPKWFDQHRWLYYSARDDFKGGWCLSCVLFLTDVEKERLGAFVRAPFRNYNKSKELLDGFEKRAFHKTSIERASCTQSQQTNAESRDTFPNSILELRPRLISHQCASNKGVKSFNGCFQS